MSASIAGLPHANTPAAAPEMFVINLCASTSPMALSHPSAPELKRYTFFVSRQREEGRERFRLHMGYFPSQEEAENLLELVRDVYPAAWAGPAPVNGARRRTRAAVMPSMVAAAAAPVPAVASAEVLSSMSNVRDVLAQLSETAAPAKAAAPAPAASMNERQVLDMLESAAARPAPAVAAESVEATQVRLVTPEDTQTLTDIRIDAQNNAPPCFAVQLVWSVSPIDVASLSHLAIFDAYTLYNVEGNREGRKWYGVRLGFFSDPASATQVANYVRSDYASVAIVPVSMKERDGAGGTPGGKALPARAGETMAKADDQLAAVGDLAGFELLADDRPTPKKLDLDDKSEVPVVKVPAAKVPVANVPVGKVPVAMPAPGPAARAAVRKAAAKITGKQLPATPGAKPTGKRVVARRRPVQPSGRSAPGAATPLESTLEILGASTLSLDEGRAIINDSAVRKPVERKGAGNRFARLLSRLSGG